MNTELLKKYNQPVPRYTSYPPANFFEDGFSATKYEEILEASNSWSPSNISFYVHIPFCNRQCLYCGCNSCTIKSDKQIDNYIQALKKEIRKVLPFIDKSRKISQIHYGGGTPNSIPLGYLNEINNLFYESFSCIDKPEIAIECHPGYLGKESLDGLILAGFNRFSFGIQDFNPDVLRNVNRKPSLIPVDELINYLRQKGNYSINLDFIYGLPGQTIDSFVDTIKKAIDLSPERLVTFSYAHVPWVNKKQLLLERVGLPSGTDKSGMFLEANKILLNNGYKMIGMDHYVQDSDELYMAQKSGNLHRNFQGYTSRRTTGQVYAFGISAISQLQYGYVQNSKSVEEYQALLNKSLLPVKKGYMLNNKELIIREAINELMCNKKLNYNELSEKLKISGQKIMSTLSINEEKLSTFEYDGIIKQGAKGITITEKGSFFIRNVAASIDPLMTKNIVSYSKSV